MADWPDLLDHGYRGTIGVVVVAVEKWKGLLLSTFPQPGCLVLKVPLTKDTEKKLQK